MEAPRRACRAATIPPRLLRGHQQRLSGQQQVHRHAQPHAGDVLAPTRDGALGLLDVGDAAAAHPAALLPTAAHGCRNPAPPGRGCRWFFLLMSSSGRTRGRRPRLCWCIGSLSRRRQPQAAARTSYRHCPRAIVRRVVSWLLYCSIDHLEPVEQCVDGASGNTSNLPPRFQRAAPHRSGSCILRIHRQRIYQPCRGLNGICAEHVGVGYSVPPCQYVPGARTPPALLQLSQDGAQLLLQCLDVPLNSLYLGRRAHPQGCSGASAAPCPPGTGRVMFAVWPMRLHRPVADMPSAGHAQLALAPPHSCHRPVVGHGAAPCLTPRTAGMLHHPGGASGKLTPTRRRGGEVAVRPLAAYYFPNSTSLAGGVVVAEVKFAPRRPSARCAAAMSIASA